MNINRLYISPVAFHPYITISHPGMVRSPDSGMGPLILRAPEFVRCGALRRPPGYMAWEVVRLDEELRYRWDPPENIKREYGADFRGHARVEGETLHVRVTCINSGDQPAPGGVSLFCLQAGALREFHDLDGNRTYVRVKDGFKSVHDLAPDVFGPKRMGGFRVNAGGAAEGQVTRGIMARQSADGDFILGIATDHCDSVSGNFNFWPSCLHANPDFERRTLQPGEEITIHLVVYFFKGTLDDLMERYVRDFGA